MLEKDLSEVKKLEPDAETYRAEAEQANTYSDRYSLFTVVFSMIMFLGAITTKMTHVQLSFTLIVLSGLICILVLIALFLTMPFARC
jgi:hypothetical protein